MKLLRTLSFFALAFVLAPAAQAATLRIQISGLRSSEGYVLLDLHNDPSAFPDHSERAVRNIKAKAAPVVNITVDNLPPGTYAFTYIHDENNNGHMNMNSLGIPLEGFGFSRDPHIGFSAPSFGSAAFSVNNAGAVVGSHMHYL